jgi:hypothetical protein
LTILGEKIKEAAVKRRVDFLELEPDCPKKLGSQQSRQK